MDYYGGNSYLFGNGTEIYKFKAKDSEIAAAPLCLGNISKYLLVGIVTYFVYYKYMNRNEENVFKYDYDYQAKNY